MELGPKMKGKRDGRMIFNNLSHLFFTLLAHILMISLLLSNHFRIIDCVLFMSFLRCFQNYFSCWFINSKRCVEVNYKCYRNIVSAIDFGDRNYSVLWNKVESMFNLNFREIDIKTRSDWTKRISKAVANTWLLCVADNITDFSKTL